MKLPVNAVSIPLPSDVYMSVERLLRTPGKVMLFKYIDKSEDVSSFYVLLTADKNDEGSFLNVKILFCLSISTPSMIFVCKGFDDLIIRLLAKESSPEASFSLQRMDLKSINFYAYLIK